MRAVVELDTAAAQTADTHTFLPRLPQDRTPATSVSVLCGTSPLTPFNPFCPVLAAASVLLPDDNNHTLIPVDSSISPIHQMEVFLTLVEAFCWTQGTFKKVCMQTPPLSMVMS